jgi:hypothetical protein
LSKFYGKTEYKCKKIIMLRGFSEIETRVNSVGFDIDFESKPDVRSSQYMDA